MGKEYGTMPTRVLDRSASDFWMNAHIRAAGVAWENEQKKKARQSGDAGAASGAQKNDLVRDQEARADRREATDGQPAPSEQLQALQDIQAGDA
jgi:hypothetical protein